MSAANQILTNYPADCRPRRIEPLGSAGGFSGAQFWRLETPRGLLCLRRWPVEFPDAEQLAFIHAVLEHVRRRGFAKVPVPIWPIAGPSFVRAGRYLWELTPWLPGRADYLPERKPAKLAAAMQTLAQWHLAAADFAGLHVEKASSSGVSPGVVARLEQLDRLMAGGFDRLIRAVDAFTPDNEHVTEIQRLAKRLLAQFPRIAELIRPNLVGATQVVVPLQPCIRDVWHDHVLFEGDEVSGIIDFRAMRIDSPCGDAARLLDSLAGDDIDVWSDGLHAYGCVRQTLAKELAIVQAVDDSLPILSGINWLEWIFGLGRTFETWPVVVERVRAIVDRVEVFHLERRSKYMKFVRDLSRH